MSQDKDLKQPVGQERCGAPLHVGTMSTWRCVYRRGHSGPCSWEDQVRAALKRVEK